jgi:UDP-GlcNAc:undecaprenyl-phosphate/decaprenyl-phosphate GlcNAc-1-phosphate transferase
MLIVDASSPVVYGTVGVASLMLTLVLTPVALRTATKLGWLDHPGGHKGQREATPYLGGAAVAIAFSGAVMIAAVLARPPGGVGELAAILVTAAALAVVGLIDDLRHLGPWTRVAFELAAGLVVWRSGIGVRLTDQPVIDAILTVAWVVAVVNAFNLLDNMDGLSAGVAALAALTFFVLAILNGQVLVATLAIALAGGTAGFLRHNFHPARIYLGDAGSMFIGFILAAIGVKLRFPDMPRDVAALIPVVALGVAVLDTGLVTTTRLLHRRNPFDGGRDHISHRLVFLGLPVHVAVGVIYAGALSTGWLAIVLSQSTRGPAWMLAGFVFVSLLTVGVLLARVPVYETSRRRRLMLKEVLPHETERPTPLSELGSASAADA